MLERSDVGVAHLDRQLVVVAMNSFARVALPVDDLQPCEKMVLSFRPERSVTKGKFLLDQVLLSSDGFDADEALRLAEEFARVRSRGARITGFTRRPSPRHRRRCRRSRRNRG